MYTSPRLRGRLVKLRITRARARCHPSMIDLPSVQGYNRTAIGRSVYVVAPSKFRREIREK